MSFGKQKYWSPFRNMAALAEGLLDSYIRALWVKLYSIFK